MPVRSPSATRGLTLHLYCDTLPQEPLRTTAGHLDEDVGGASPRGGSDDEDSAQLAAGGLGVRLGHAELRAAAARMGAGGAAAGTAHRGAGGGVGGDDDAEVRREGRSCGWGLPSRLERCCLPAGAHTPPTLRSPFEQLELDLEARQLRDGEYVAVRRFTRILERGPDAKTTVDQVGAGRAGGAGRGADDGGAAVLRARAAPPLHSLEERPRPRPACRPPPPPCRSSLPPRRGSISSADGLRT